MKRRPTTATKSASRIPASADPAFRRPNPIAFGGEIKAVKQADGTIKATGVLVRFTTPDDPDLCGDFFTKDTYFGEDIAGKRIPIYFHHGIQIRTTDAATGAVKLVGPGRRKIGVGTLSVDPAKGILLEAIIDDAQEYHEDLQGALDGQQLGWSSGAVSHVVTRKAHLDESLEFVKAFEITGWPLGEGSMTHIPAEPRNLAEAEGKSFTFDHALKSLSDIVPDAAIKGALSDFGSYSWDYEHGYDDVWEPDVQIMESVTYTFTSRLRQAITNIATDENISAADQITAINQCFDEARTLIVGLVEALAGMMPALEDAEGAGKSSALVTSFHSAFKTWVGDDDSSSSPKSGSGLSLLAQGEKTLAVVTAYTERIAAVAALRAAKSGGKISAENTKTLETMRDLALKLLQQPTPSPAPGAGDIVPAPGAGDDADDQPVTLSAEELESLGIDLVS